MEELLNALAPHANPLAAAFVIGLLLGMERQIRDKPAGLRTMVLICMGSCIFSVVSLRYGVDPTRIAAQIVTGVGFLGAGSILRSSKAVYGLTTAATIWVASALGMACGFGEYLLAYLATAIVLAVLIGFHRFVDYLDRTRAIIKYRIATDNDAYRRNYFEKLFLEFGLKILSYRGYREHGKFTYSIRAQGPTEKHAAMAEKLLYTTEYELLKS